MTLPGRGPATGGGGRARQAARPATARSRGRSEPLLSEAALARAERAAAGEKDAIIALVGPAAEPVQQALERLGFHVDVVDDIEEGARLLEQGVYEVAVTAATAPEPGSPETLAQRMLRMPLDARRRVFVILVGDEFRTGDGTQAWAAQADLVAPPGRRRPREHLIRATMTERKRLYQPLVDARRRVETE